MIRIKAKCLISCFNRSPTRSNKKVISIPLTPNYGFIVSHKTSKPDLKEYFFIILLFYGFMVLYLSLFLQNKMIE